MQLDNNWQLNYVDPGMSPRIECSYPSIVLLCCRVVNKGRTPVAPQTRNSPAGVRLNRIFSSGVVRHAWKRDSFV